MSNPTFFYDNRLTDATVSGSTTAVNYAAVNVTDWRPYTWWKPSAMPATLTVDCGSSKAADYAAIFGHDLFSKSATLEIRGSTDNFSTSDVLVASLTPASDSPILLTFTSVSYRYWRVRVTGASAPSLAIASIGARMVMPQALPEGYDPLGRQIQGQNNRNENGQPLGRVISYELWSQTLRFQRVTWSWLRSTFLPAWRAQLRAKPFLYCWDTDLYPDDLKLVTIADKFDAPHSRGNVVDLSIPLEAVVT